MNKFEFTLSELKGTFDGNKDIITVYLYGSVARGDYSLRHSDLDLFIIVKKLTKKIKRIIDSKIIPIGLKHGVKIHAEFQGARIKKDDQSLFRKIIEEGKIIYSSGTFNFSYEQLGLKQYVIYSFSLKNSMRKTLFSKVLHGRKAWYYKGKKKIIKEYAGIANNNEIILLGKGYLMVRKDMQKDIEILFKRFNVEYSTKRIVYG